MGNGEGVARHRDHWNIPGRGIGQSRFTERSVFPVGCVIWQDRTAWYAASPAFSNALVQGVMWRRTGEGEMFEGLFTLAAFRLLKRGGEYADSPGWWSALIAL